MKSAPVFYLLSYALSLLGNSIAGIALPLIVLQATGSILSAGLLAAATAVPAFLAGLVTGLVIDRTNRRTASVAADLISAVSIAALPLVDLLTGLTLGWFIVLGILGSVGDMPGLTAREALLPAVIRAGNIPAEKLLGIRESIGALVMVVGPAAAGGLMVAFDGSTVLWITAATSLAAAGATVLIPRGVVLLPAEPDAGPPQQSAWNQLQHGWSTLFRRDTVLRGATLLTLGMITAVAALQGIILPAHFSLLDRPGHLGFTLAVLAAGTLAGSASYAGWASDWAQRRWLAVGLAGSATGMAVTGSLPPSWGLFPGAFVLGTAMGLLGCVTGVLMVERIPEEMAGRILGTQNSLVLLAAPAGMIAAAFLAERFGLTAAGITVAVLWSLAAAAALRSPLLRRSGSGREACPGKGRVSAAGTMDQERMGVDEKQ